MPAPSGPSRAEAASGADAAARPREPWWTARFPSLPQGDLAAAAALGALVLAMFWRLLAGRVLFERDIAVLFHPQAEAFFTAIRQGSWPLWNPYPGFGEPMLANANTQVLYPPTWLLLLLPPATYYSVYVLLHLVFGGLGLYALARHLGLSRPAALTGAGVFLVGGPTLSLINVWNHFAGACWMPWVVLASLRAVRDGRPRAALVWGIAVAAQVFAGSPDLCALTIAATLAGWAAAAPAEIVRRPRALAAAIGLAVLTATALSAGQWLPTLAAARAGSRRAFPFEQRAFWSVHPLSLGQLLAPLPLREVVNFSPRGGEMFDIWEPFIASIYLGAAACALAAAALAAPRARAARVLALFTTAALVIALGRHTPAYGLLTRAVPPLAMFRFPSKVMILVGWSWALLVALGAEEWWRAPSGSWRRGTLAATGVLAVGLGAAGLIARAAAARGGLPFLGPAAEGGDEVARHMVAALVWAWLAVVLVAAATACAARGGRRLAAAVMLVAVADLALAHRGLNATAPAAFFRYRPEVLRLLPQGPPAPRLFVWDYVVHKPRVQEMPLAEMLHVRPGFPLALGRSLALQAYLYPPSYARWGLYGGFDRDLLGLAPPALGDLVGVLSRLNGTAAYPHLLALGGVDAVLAMHDDGLAGLTPLGQVEGPLERPVRAFAVPGARPRAYLVGEARTAQGTDALRMLLDPAFDPARAVVLPEAPGASGGPGARALQVTRDAADRFEAEVAQDQPGWLVRLVTHDPGWRVQVDGVPSPLLRADHAFQGVLVPAGRHHVAIVYRPRPVLAGLAITAVAAALVAIALVRRPRPAGAPPAPVPAAPGA